MFSFEDTPDFGECKDYFEHVRIYFGEVLVARYLVRGEKLARERGGLESSEWPGRKKQPLSAAAFWGG